MPITGKLSDHRDFASRAKVIKELERRCLPDKSKWLIEKEIALPHGKSRVKIILNGAKTMASPLLAGPRIVKEGYLFFNNGPFGGMPGNPTYVAGLNTGKACRETHKQLITDPDSQILLPVTFYIDAANTGQFADLPVAAVKIALGMFNRKARGKQHLWRALGHMPKIHKHKSTGDRLLRDSNHVDAAMALHELFEEEGTKPDKNVFKAQGLHSMLPAVLEPCVKLQNTGFIWDFRHGNA